MGRVEYLEPWHFEEWGAPFVPKDIVGYAMRGNDGSLICLGGIWFIEGNAWATFDSRGKPPPRVHAWAVRLVKSIRAAGVNVIWAELDDRKPGARKWLERFGFVYHAHNSEGIEVWRLELDGGSSLDGCHDGRSRRDQGLRSGT